MHGRKGGKEEGKEKGTLPHHTPFLSLSGIMLPCVSSGNASLPFHWPGLTVGVGRRHAGEGWGQVK